MDQPSDAELMERVADGSFAAFDELYRRHAERVRRFLFSLTWDHDLADDYLQEVFLRLFRARNRYRPAAKFTTYLLQIAMNYYLTQRRKRCELPLPPDCGRLLGIRANERVEPDVRLMEEYRRFCLRRAILALPEGPRLVFVLAHVEDMKYEQVAEVLGVPVGTVKSRMHAAVRKLRPMLEEVVR